MHLPLLAWYDDNRRDLPWRRTQDPYAIWVSEIMLQQTQVATVIPYFERWMRRFPTIESLAQADEQEVLSLWQGLGYYRRCRSLLEGAQYTKEHGLPQSAEDWLKVPGVGRYTAGAIASIAQGQCTPVVDGNVERVFARLTSCEATGASLTKAAWVWARAKVPEHRPGDWNQALMELGATVCIPNNPLCSACPISDRCTANRLGLQNVLPKPKPAPKTIKLNQIVWIPYISGTFGLEQIPSGDWWHGMWQFPRAESEHRLQNLLGSCRPERLGTLRHQVTHHRITIDAYLVRDGELTHKLRWVQAVEMDAIPMPAPQRKLLGMALDLLAVSG